MPMTLTSRPDRSSSRRTSSTSSWSPVWRWRTPGTERRWSSTRPPRGGAGASRRPTRDEREGLGMTSHDTYADLGEAAWRWVLDQVQWDDGPWIPETVPHSGGPPEQRDGMHSGIGGLAHVLAEVRASRAWSAEE